DAGEHPVEYEGGDIITGLRWHALRERIDLHLAQEQDIEHEQHQCAEHREQHRPPVAEEAQEVAAGQGPDHETAPRVCRVVWAPGTLVTARKTSSMDPWRISTSNTPSSPTAIRVASNPSATSTRTRSPSTVTSRPGSWAMS